MTTEDKDPLAWLDQTHPHYDRMNTVERWMRWRAVLDGMNDPETKKTFLPKTEVELDCDYEFRIKIAEFLGTTDGAIDRLTGAVFGVPAKIDAGNDLVQQFVKDCDGNGTTLVDFMETVSPEAQGMGISFILISKAGVAETPKTQLHEKQLGGLRCFATQHTAEEVRNWGFGDDAAPSYMILGRTISRQNGASGDIEWIIERRLITRWQMFIFEKNGDENGEPKSEKERYALRTMTDHDLDALPIVPHYGIYLDQFRGSSMVAGTMKADIARFNEETWGSVDRYRHANPLLNIQSDREIGDIVKGPAFRTQTDEKIEYVSPTSACFDARENAIKRLERQGISQSGTNPSATSDGPNSTTGESGIAQRTRFTHTEKRAIEKHARSTEQSITQILKIVGLYFGIKNLTPKVSFFTTFDSLEPDQRISTFKATQFWIQSPTWQKEMLKRIAIESMPDLDEDVKDQIIKEIESAPIIDPNVDPMTKQTAA